MAPQVWQRAACGLAGIWDVGPPFTAEAPSPPLPSFSYTSTLLGVSVLRASCFSLVKITHTRTRHPPTVWIWRPSRRGRGVSGTPKSKTYKSRTRCCGVNFPVSNWKIHPHLQAYRYVCTDLNLLLKPTCLVSHQSLANYTTYYRCRSYRSSQCPLSSRLCSLLVACSAARVLF